MKFLAFVAALTVAPLASAGPAGAGHSGADDFRKVVVQCMVTGMQAGATDPVALAEACVEATQVIWAASYPSVCSGVFGP